MSTEDHIARAELGEKAKAFVESEIGEALLAKALDMRAIALEAMEDVNPTDSTRIEELQRLAKLPRYFEQWLGELIQAGDAAFEILKQQNEGS